MKTKHWILTGTALLIASAISFTGCRKPKEKDQDTSGAEDNSLADKSFEDIGQLSNEAANGSVSSYKFDGSQGGILGACAQVTIDTAAKKIVVSFPTPCLCKDNRWRVGKLFISYTGKSYWDSLMSVTITTTMAGDPGSDSYKVGSDQNSMHRVIGTKVITNKGHNSAGHMNWDINVDGKIIKASNGGTIEWKSQRNREWLQGEGTLQWHDDVYGITGTADGKSANGTAFNVTITSQLIRKLDPNCIRWFTAGTLDFTPGSKAVRHVDFSPPNNGACDNVATVTINGNTYTIYMK